MLFDWLENKTVIVRDTMEVLVDKKEIMVIASQRCIAAGGHNRI